MFQRIFCQGTEYVVNQARCMPRGGPGLLSHPVDAPITPAKTVAGHGNENEGNLVICRVRGSASYPRPWGGVRSVPAPQHIERAYRVARFSGLRNRTHARSSLSGQPKLRDVSDPCQSDKKCECELFPPVTSKLVCVDMGLAGPGLYMSVRERPLAPPASCRPVLTPFKDVCIA